MTRILLPFVSGAASIVGIAVGTVIDERSPTTIGIAVGVAFSVAGFSYAVGRELTQIRDHQGMSAERFDHMNKRLDTLEKVLHEMPCQGPRPPEKCKE